MLALAWLFASGAVHANGTHGQPLAGTPRASTVLPDCVAPCGSAAGHAGAHGQASLVLASTPTLFSQGEGPDRAAGATELTQPGAHFDALSQAQEASELSLVVGSTLEPLALSLAGASTGATAAREPAVPQPTLGLVLLAVLGVGALGVQAHVRKGSRRG